MTVQPHSPPVDGMAVALLVPLQSKGRNSSEQKRRTGREAQSGCGLAGDRNSRAPGQRLKKCSQAVLSWLGLPLLEREEKCSFPLKHQTQLFRVDP